jgi:hypothetical protein
MLKTTGCGLFGGEFISGRISINDVAVHGKNDIKQSKNKHVRAPCTSILQRNRRDLVIIFKHPPDYMTPPL